MSGPTTTTTTTVPPRIPSCRGALTTRRRRNHKDDAALGAAPEQPTEPTDDVHRAQEASLGARDPMALLAEARREADAARAAKMRAIEGMMRGARRPRVGRRLGGLKAASAAAALGVAPEDGDRDGRHHRHHPPAPRRSASPGHEARRGMGRAKAGVGVGAVVAAVAAFGVVAVVAAVTRRSAAAPGAGDRGSDAERIPLVTGRKARSRRRGDCRSRRRTAGDGSDSRARGRVARRRVGGGAARTATRGTTGRTWCDADARVCEP